MRNPQIQKVGEWIKTMFLRSLAKGAIGIQTDAYPAIAKNAPSITRHRFKLLLKYGENEFAWQI